MNPYEFFYINTMKPIYNKNNVIRGLIWKDYYVFLLNYNKSRKSPGQKSYINNKAICDKKISKLQSDINQYLNYIDIIHGIIENLNVEQKKVSVNELINLQNSLTSDDKFQFDTDNGIYIKLYNNSAIPHKYWNRLLIYMIDIKININFTKNNLNRFTVIIDKKWWPYLHLIMETLEDKIKFCKEEIEKYINQ